MVKTRTFWKPLVKPIVDVENYKTTTIVKQYITGGMMKCIKANQEEPAQNIQIWTTFKKLAELCKAKKQQEVLRDLLKYVNETI